jgi:hypothetical protein
MAAKAPSRIEMDFTVISEDYSRYLVPDGTTLAQEAITDLSRCLEFMTRPIRRG